MMTNEDRTELLREVARVAPDDLDVECDIEDVAWFWGGDYPLALKDDMVDSGAIIGMLDAMERAGFNTANSFDQVQIPPVYDCTAYKWPTPDDRQYHNCKGTTRAEAISRTFVAVFGGKG